MLQEKIGRELFKYEQVHHIDGNPFNNDLDNLELVLLGEHQRIHSQKYEDKMTTCDWCGKQYLWTAKQQGEHYRNRNRDRKEYNNMHFCSRKCSGEYGAYIQHKYAEMSE